MPKLKVAEKDKNATYKLRSLYIWVETERREGRGGSG